MPRKWSGQALKTTTGRPFGPAGDVWTYSAKTKMYDLSWNTQGKIFQLDVTRGPSGISFTVDLNITALVIIDIQNFFLYLSCNNHPMGVAASQQTLCVI